MVYSNYSNWWYHIWLVVWNMNFIFTFSWEFHNPNWLIFFRGVRIPPTRYLTEKLVELRTSPNKCFPCFPCKKAAFSSACSLFFNGGTGCIRCLVNGRWLKWHWVNTLRSSRIAIEYYYNGGFNGKIIYNLQLLSQWMIWALNIEWPRAIFDPWALNFSHSWKPSWELWTYEFASRISPF